MSHVQLRSLFTAFFHCIHQRRRSKWPIKHKRKDIELTEVALQIHSSSLSLKKKNKYRQQEVVLQSKSSLTIRLELVYPLRNITVSDTNASHEHRISFSIWSNLEHHTKKRFHVTKKVHCVRTEPTDANSRNVFATQ